VLTHLRGLSRDRVLRDLHRLAPPRPPAAALGAESPGDSTASAEPDDLDDLVVAEDAAARAARQLQQDRPFDGW